jgi:hypothetical protein
MHIVEEYRVLKLISKDLKETVPHYRMVEWQDTLENTAGSISTLIRFGYICLRVYVNQVMWRAENDDRLVWRDG